jgi:glucose-1-phosphate cytidylyltransferase
MKCVIVAGGAGSRLSEETDLRPKPMVEIGGKPIIWHIMKCYSHFGINDFVICLGYKGYMIKEYFANYFLHQADVAFDLPKNRMEILESSVEPWRVTLVETGLETQTGGRLKKVVKYIGDQPFCFTYGDGVADVDIKALIDFHMAQGRLATVTAVQPPARFGRLSIQDDSSARSFVEKPSDGGWINGGFFVLSPKALQFIDGPETPWETTPMERLTSDGQLACYRHRGFWQPMDTLRDKRQLEVLWASGCAPWKVWR